MAASGAAHREQASLENEAQRIAAGVGVITGSAGLVVGLVMPIWPPTELPGPPLVAPVPDEVGVDRAAREARSRDLARHEIDEEGIRPGEAAHEAVGAAADVAGRCGRVDAAEIHADEAAGEVVAAATGDRGGGGRGGVDDRADIDADEAAQVAVGRPVHRPGRRRVVDLAAVHADEAADDAVRARAGDRSEGGGRVDRALCEPVFEIGDADKPAQDTVGAADDRAARLRVAGSCPRSTPRTRRRRSSRRR